MPIASPEKAAAKAAGLKTYNGTPCHRGHGALRLTINGTCVECSRQSSRAWSRRNPEGHREKRARFRARNPVAVREHQTRKNLKRFYGLTFEQYDALFECQHGRCAVCTLPLVRQTDRARPFTKHVVNAVGRVDHDHETNAVRGLLCGKCNTLLGNARDNEQILLNAIGYLRASATQSAQPVAARESASEISAGKPGPRVERCRGSRRDELCQFID